MKVTQEREDFKPVTIVLESQAEVDALLICLNINGKEFEASCNELGSTIPTGREEAASLRLFPMWKLVQALYK